MEKKSIREMISVIFKAVTLAMGVAVVVLSCLGSLDPQTAVPLLGIWYELQGDYGGSVRKNTSGKALFPVVRQEVDVHTVQSDSEDAEG